MEALAEFCEVGGWIVGPCEVREEEFRGAAREDGLEGLIPQCEIDIGWRCSGQDVWAVIDADSADVADEGYAFGVVEVCDVVGGVAGCVGDVESARA